MFPLYIPGIPEGIQVPTFIPTKTEVVPHATLFLPSGDTITDYLQSPYLWHMNHCQTMITYQFRRAMMTNHLYELWQHITSITSTNHDESPRSPRRTMMNHLDGTWWITSRSHDEVSNHVNISSTKPWWTMDAAFPHHHQALADIVCTWKPATLACCSSTASEQDQTHWHHTLTPTVDPGQPPWPNP